MTNEKKNQHYLPQFYLRGFEAQGLREGAGHVYVYQAPEESNDAQSTPKSKPATWRTRSIRHIASEPFRHSILQDDGTYDHRIEDALAYIEGAVRPAVQKVRMGEQLTSDDREYFALFVMLMLQRVPNRTDTALKFLNKVEEWRHALRQQFWAGSDDPDAQAAYRFHYLYS